MHLPFIGQQDIHDAIHQNDAVITGDVLPCGGLEGQQDQHEGGGGEGLERDHCHTDYTCRLGRLRLEL